MCGVCLRLNLYDGVVFVFVRALLLLSVCVSLCVVVFVLWFVGIALSGFAVSVWFRLRCVSAFAMCVGVCYV